MTYDLSPNPSTPTAPLDAALGYAKRGWKVLPLSPRSKVPLHGTHGYKSATTDTATLQVYWSAEPNANIGLSQDGSTLAIDVDPRNGGIDSFQRLLKMLEALPPTLTVSTPSGGFHYRFALPKNHGLPAKFNINSLFEGIDFLVDKSYLVAPPSQHPNGGVYRWLDGLGPDDIEIAQAPAELVKLLITSRFPAHRAGNNRPSVLLEVATTSNTLSQSDSKAEAASIMRGCAYMSHCHENAQELTEPEWYAMLSIAGRCHNGRALAHELSKPYPQYSESETDKKLDQALKMPPRTCDSIEREQGFSGCLRCPFRASDMASPYALGFQSQALILLQTRHIFDISTGRFHDITSDDISPMGKQAFTDKFRHDPNLKKPLPDARFLDSKTAPKVDEVDYLPGDVRLVRRQASKRVMNLWRDTGVAPQDGDCAIILDHIDFIIPEMEFRAFVLNALASLMQSPQTKLPAVLITGGQGIGKSFMHHLLERLVGSSNIRKLESEAMESRFKASMGNIQVLTFDELMHPGRLEISNKMKDWISEEYVMTEEKNIRQHKVRTPRLILAFSNSDTPIYVSEDDRRWAVYESPARPKDADYYRQLFLEGLSQAPAFKHWLLKRDIAEFNPNARPPMTASKRELIKNSKTPLAFELQNLLEAEAPPFNKALVTIEEVRQCLWTFSPNTQPASHIQRALKEIGARPLSQQVRIGGVKKRFWSIRDHDRWEAALPEEVRQCLESRTVGPATVDVLRTLSIRSQPHCLTSQQ